MATLELDTAVVALLLSALGILLSIYVVITSNRKNEGKEVRELENRLTRLEEKPSNGEELKRIDDKLDAISARLTTIEASKLTEAERTCIHDLNTKVGLLWNNLLSTLPRSLMKHSTPAYDRLLRKAERLGPSINLLTEKEYETLLLELDKDYAKAVAGEEPDRILQVALYRDMLRLERGEKISAPKACAM